MTTAWELYEARDREGNVIDSVERRFAEGILEQRNFMPGGKIYDRPL